MIINSTSAAAEVTPEVVAASTDAFAQSIDSFASSDISDSSEQIQAFDQILQRFEQNTLTERDKGTAFELLVRDVLSKAQPWCDQFVKVQTYAEWAKEHQELTGGDARDTGVDLVATSIATTKLDTTKDIENRSTPPIIV